MRQLKISKQLTNREITSLDKYLQEIGRLEMITPEEEVVLAQKIKQGDQAALDKLTKANLRFVVSVAKQYQNQGLQLQDLINEGNIGLIKAAQRFDETRGFKFISFAVWWIRQSILQAIAEQSRMVRLPLHQVGLLSKIKKAKADLEQRLERTPSDEEVAAELGIPKEKLLETVTAGTRTTSVDAPLTTDEDTTLIDTLEQNSVDSTDNSVMKESLQHDVSIELSKLSDQERTILKQYYGIELPRNLTLDEIAERNNITRERVRKIKERALSRLKKSESIDTLKKYTCQ